MRQLELEWDDLSRGQKIELFAICILTIGSALLIVNPILASLHPMFVGDIIVRVDSPLELLFSPSGLAIIGYCVVVLTGYSYARYPEYR